MEDELEVLNKEIDNHKQQISKLEGKVVELKNKTKKAVEEKREIVSDKQTADRINKIHRWSEYTLGLLLFGEAYVEKSIWALLIGLACFVPACIDSFYAWKDKLEEKIKKELEKKIGEKKNG